MFLIYSKNDAMCGDVPGFGFLLDAMNLHNSQFYIYVCKVLDSHVVYRLDRCFVRIVRLNEDSATVDALVTFCSSVADCGKWP